MNSEVQSALGFNLHAPLKTIYAFLNSLQPPMIHLLDDELIETATKEIRPEGKPRKLYRIPPPSPYYPSPPPPLPSPPPPTSSTGALCANFPQCTTRNKRKRTSNRNPLKTLRQTSPPRLPPPPKRPLGRGREATPLCGGRQSRVSPTEL